MGRRKSQNRRRIPSGMQVHRNEYRPNLNGINQKTRKKSNDASHPLCSTTGFLAVGGPSSLGWVLQSVADCFKCRLIAQAVADRHKLLQLVATIRNLPISASRHVRAVPILDEGANRLHRWTRIHNRAEKHQDWTWSTCAPSFPSSPPQAWEKLSRLGEQLTLDWRRE